MSSLVPVTPEDVREVRRVLSEWTLERYTAVRAEQREKGAAPRALVLLRHNATLEEALRTLAEHRILSAPIVDAYTGDYMGTLHRSVSVACPCTRARLRRAARAAGFLSMGDLLKWLLKGARPARRASSSASTTERCGAHRDRRRRVHRRRTRALTPARAGLYPSLLNPELRTASAMEAFLASAPPNLTNMAAWARSGFLSEHLIRPGEDGDIVYKCARRLAAARHAAPL